MRSSFIVFGLAIVTLTLIGTVVHAEKVRCSAIRDSAMCLSEPSCWYDAANNKGCLDGPAPNVDRCNSHVGESTCNTSSFGCTWNTGAEACVSKSP